MQKLPTLPNFSDPIVRDTQSGPVLQDAYYAFLKQLFAVVVEQRDQIETLRVALNEVRQNPGTTYPIIPNF